MNVTIEVVATLVTVVATVVGNLIALVRIYSRMESRMDVFEANATHERTGLREQVSLIASELQRLRDTKHDHTGTVMRHEGAIKDQERRLSRIETYCFHQHHVTEGEGGDHT